MLEAERCVEVVLLVRARDHTVRQSRQCTSRVERAVVDAVGLVIVPRARQKVQGEVVVSGELVACAARQGMDLPRLDTIRELVEVGEGCQVVVLPKECLAAGAAVAKETIAAVEREPPVLVADAGAEIRLSGGGRG